jgi:hypothetical protein
VSELQASHSHEVGRPALGRVTLATYALHPLVLCEFVAFAHGDSLMIALLALAYWAWVRDKIVLSAALCAAGTATRSVAVLALLALGVVLAKTRPRAILAALVGALIASLFVGVSSLWEFGEVSLGGAPALNGFSAPISYALVTAGVPNALLLGVTAQAAAGAFLGLVVLRRWWAQPNSHALCLLPLAALPAIYPHYVAWLVAFLSLRPSGRFAAVARVATFTAPLWYVARLNSVAPPEPSALAYGIALALTWGAVLFALFQKNGPVDQNSIAKPPHLAGPRSGPLVQL